MEARDRTLRQRRRRAGRMKDHPHLRGAAESYNSLKEAFLLLFHLSKMMGQFHFCFHRWLIMHTHRHRRKIILICLLTSKSVPNVNKLHISWVRKCTSVCTIGHFSEKIKIKVFFFAPSVLFSIFFLHQEVSEYKTPHNPLERNMKHHPLRFALFGPVSSIHRL